MVEDIRHYMKLFEISNSQIHRIKTVFEAYFDYEQIPASNDTKPDEVMPGVSIDENGLISVKGHVFSKRPSPTGILPVKFHTVEQDFNIDHAGLTTLKGCPFHVGGNFNCIENDSLKSFDYLPEVIKFDLSVGWTPHIPMLRLVKYQYVFLNNAPYAFRTIFEKYLKPDISRKDIIACQKELIDNGFEGNAKW